MTQKNKDMAKKNKEIRDMYYMPHSAGLRSFAYIAHDIRKKRKTSTRAVVFDVIHMRKDGSFLNDDIRDKVKKMRALSSRDTAASSSMTKGSIIWALDDTYAKVMGTAENTARVRGMGPGHLPVKGSTHANRSSSLAAQVPALLARINQQDQQISMLTSCYNDMRKSMLSFFASQGTNNVNMCTQHDNECPDGVRARSSVASRPDIGENELTNEDEHATNGNHPVSSQSNH